MGRVPRSPSVPLACAVLALAILTAGCGGGGGRSAEDWADDVCSELDTWATSVSGAVTGVMSQGRSVTGADLRAAARRAGAATSRLADGLREIEPPDVDSAEHAQDELRQLGDGLERHAAKARDLVQGAGGDVVDVARSVLVEIGAAADEAQSALDALQALGDDLRSGIAESDACTRLRERDFAVG